MQLNNINALYNKIFDTYPKVEIEEHIKKLIELDYFYMNFLITDYSP